MKKLVLSCVLVLAMGGMVSADTIRGIDIDFVTIGNAGNVADTMVMNDGTTGYGAVSSSYRIGKYEVTNAQWNTFTAAAGAPTGNDGGYGVSAYWTGAQQPTNMVSWHEAAQFCNYLTSGNKYSGAYKFDISGNFLEIDRASSISTYGTTYVIPTEDEWHKAAYFKPNASGYSLYAFGADTDPIAGVQSNYNYVITSPWNVGSGAQEQNGTYDMMGNVWEWNETLLYGSNRGLLGGSYFDIDRSLASSYRYSIGDDPGREDIDIGFRVASVPEPASAVLLLLGAGLFKRRRG